MITLPDGFDYTLLMNDLFSFVLPFISIAMLFVAYRLINKALGGVH